jgi:large subunit ribosomal protein L3
VQKQLVQNMKFRLVDEAASMVAVKGNNVPVYRNAYVFIWDASKETIHGNLLLK